MWSCLYTQCLFIEYWVNSENNITIPNSKWSWDSTAMIFSNDIAPSLDGCLAVRILWNSTHKHVMSSVIKVRCERWSSVRSYICEKPDNNYIGKPSNI